MRHWWNGRFGRLARRDIKIHLDDNGWRVEAIEGGTEGRRRCWEPPTEEDALLLVDELMAGSDGWQELGKHTNS